MKKKIKKILFSILMASATALSLTSCDISATSSTANNSTNGTNPISETTMNLESNNATTTQYLPNSNAPYSDTPSWTWKDLDEPSYKYECWKEYDRWPDWYNPYRPWENEPENFNYKDIMEYNINDDGDSITWDGTIVYREKEFKIEIENSDYLFESNSNITHYTNEQIKTLYENNKLDENEYYISEISYTIKTNDKYDYETNYYNFEGYGRGDYSILDINKYISSIEGKIMYFSIKYSKYTDDEKNIINFKNAAESYFKQEEISHFDFRNFELYSNYRNTNYEYMNYNNYIQFQKDEDTNDNIAVNSNATQDKTLAIKDFFEHNKDKDFIIINNKYNYWDDLYNLFDAKATDYEKNFYFYYIVSKVNFVDLSLEDYNGEYNSIFAFNLTTVDDNVADVKLEDIGDIKFQAGVTYILKIVDGKIKIVKTDRNISKDTFANFLYDYIMDAATPDVQVTVNNNINLNLSSNVSLDQTSNGNFNDFENTGVIGQNALDSSIDISDKKEKLSKTIDTLNLTDKTLSYTVLFDYYGYKYTRYYDYTLENPQISYDYYYMNYQNYKNDNSKTEFGPAYLNYKITITFDAVHVDSLQQECMIWDTEIGGWKTYFEPQDYEKYNIKHNADGKFTIVIEYNNNPEIAESERLKYSLSLLVDNTDVSDNVLNKNKIEKQYISWDKTITQESFTMNVGSNVTEYTQTVYEGGEEVEKTYTNEILAGINSHSYTTEDSYKVVTNQALTIEEKSSLTQNNVTSTLYEGTQNNIIITISNED